LSQSGHETLPQIKHQSRLVRANVDFLILLLVYENKIVNKCTLRSRIKPLWALKLYIVLKTGSKQTRILKSHSIIYDTRFPRLRVEILRSSYGLLHGCYWLLADCILPPSSVLRTKEHFCNASFELVWREFVLFFYIFCYWTYEEI